MIEKIKNVVLALLVITSLIFTYLLWFGTPSYEVSKPITSEKIQFSNPRSIEEIIIPGKIIFREEDYYNVFYPSQSLHDAAREVIISFFSSGIKAYEALDEDNWLKISSEKGMLVHYPYPYPLIVSTTDESKKILTVNKLFIPKQESTVYIKAEGSFFKIDTYYEGNEEFEFFLSKAREGDPYRLLQIEDLFKTEEIEETEDLSETEELPEVYFLDDIYVSVGEIQLPVRYVQKEKLEIDRLLKVFFADISLVRRIEEKDGAVIYSDGQRGLRIYPTGAIEFTSAENRETLLSGERAISMAGEIIALYGGWQEGIHLWVSPEIKNPYFRTRITFKQYIEGYPLLTEDVAIRLTLNERGAQTYYRSILIPQEEVGEPENIISGEEALMAGIEYLASERDDSIGIRDLYLSYFPFGTEIKQLTPVWVLETNKELIIINGYIGNLLDIRAFD